MPPPLPDCKLHKVSISVFVFPVHIINTQKVVYYIKFSLSDHRSKILMCGWGDGLQKKQTHDNGDSIGRSLSARGKLKNYSAWVTVTAK